MKLRHHAKDANCTPLRQEVTQSHAEDLRDLLHGMHPGMLVVSGAQFTLTHSYRPQYWVWFCPLKRMSNSKRSLSPPVLAWHHWVYIYVFTIDYVLILLLSTYLTLTSLALWKHNVNLLLHSSIRIESSAIINLCGVSTKLN